MVHVEDVNLFIYNYFYILSNLLCNYNIYMSRTNQGMCKNNLLVLFVVILLTILIVYIALNSYNKEMFTNLTLNNQNKDGNILFYTNLLNNELQSKVDNMITENINERDNNVLSQRHLSQVYETRRPELINQTPEVPENLCYLNLENMR
jgi:hypothetical protein